jgi:hypothetical protein
MTCPASRSRIRFALAAAHCIAIERIGVREESGVAKSLGRFLCRQFLLA